MDCYDGGIIIGPGGASLWNLKSSWDTGAAQLSSLLRPEKYHTWESSNFWGFIDFAPDGWPASLARDNTILIARHLACAADFVYSLCYLRAAVGQMNRTAIT